MRELVYLSERKLRQFQLDRPPRGWLKRITEVGVKGPFNSGEVKVNLGDDSAKSHPDLASVLDYIDRSDRPSKWYAQDDVLPGDWVQFESRLAYEIVDVGRQERAELVLFWEPLVQFSDGGHQKMLLLHGSANHLVWNVERRVPQSEWPYCGSGAPMFMELLASVANDDARSQRILARSLNKDLRVLMEMLHYVGTPPEMAAWMTGYARVTCDTGLALVASPLYVEYTSPPDETHIG